MKQTLFNTVVFLKRPNVINRLILFGGSLLILFLFFIPDLKFNLQMKNPPKMTIEEIKNSNKENLPRYINIDGGQLLEATLSIDSVQNLAYQSFNYVEESHIKKGDTTLSAIYYPIYSVKEIKENPKKTASEITSYVVIKESKITKGELVDNKYFKQPTFKLNGRFSGTSINEENLSLLNESGYNISKDAIILEKGSTPVSLTTSIIGTIILSIVSILMFLALMPMSLLHKMFNVEQEIVRIQ